MKAAFNVFRKLNATTYGGFLLSAMLLTHSPLSSAQSCSGAADMWFANDESGSVSNAEMTQALDFLYQVADDFVFDEISGAKAGVFGWSNNLSPAEYIIPASDTYADSDDTGLLDPNRDGSALSNISVDNDGRGIRELYPARTYTSGTWLAAATNHLNALISSTVDSNSDDVSDNGRRDGVPQIAVLLTDATASQLKTAGSGGSAGQEGGSDWDTAMSALQSAGPDGTNIVLMLIDVAAVAYGTPGAGNEGTAGDPAVRTLIDSFVTNYGVSLYVGGTYAEIADPVNNFVSGLVDAVCELADIALYIKNQPATYNSLASFTVTFEFSEDVSGFTLSDIVVGNGTPSNLIQVSPAIYTAEILPDGSNSDITIDVGVNAAQSIPDAKPSRPAAQGITEYDGDGDGVGDTSEGTTTDSDGDGVFDNEDIDSDNDGIPDAIENNNGAVDTDGDGVFDYLDLDSDNDGIPDLIESGSSLALALDSDGDGQFDLSNTFGLDGLVNNLQTGGEGGPLNYVVADNDSDTVLDFRDLDSDNDSLSDLVESGIDTATIAALDADSDGDIDTPAENAANAVGTDGIVDSLQSATDGAPITHSIANSDDDAFRDAIDLDADSDGIPDLIEGGNAAAIALDTNNDGRIQTSESPVGSDGIANGAQGGSDGGALTVATNSDSANETGVAIPDFRDGDSDNDGVLDSIESGVTDNNVDGIADGSDGNGDGMIDSGFAITPTNTAPTGDAPDYQNTNSNGAGAGDDNDGDSDAGPLDSSPNDGVLDDTTDTDGDGIADSRDDSIGVGVLPALDILFVETAGDTIVNEDGAGNTDTVSVVLQRQPLGDVVVIVSSADTSEATVPATILTFTTTDWDQPQPVTVTGVSDNFVDGDLSINLNAVVDDALSSNEYDGLAGSVDVTVVDTTPDADGDGISDVQEGTGDADGDGTPDSADIDSDNDGIDDSVEAGNDPEDIADSDGDTIPDYLEFDADNDGIIDSLEVGPTPNSPIDTDNDGTPDFQDMDSDSDGIPDSVEDVNTPMLSGVDTVSAGAPGEGNGIDDTIDVLATLGVDSNGNGVDDLFEPSNSDADALADHRDLDSDGDGILDIIEAGNIPVPLGVDSDGDGFDDSIDVDATVGGEDINGNGLDDRFEPRDSDRDGTPDFQDIDSDNDGIPDSVEAGSLTPLSGNDTDADGIDDAIDADNGGSVTDVNNNGISDDGEPVDFDGDGTPNYLDLDSDNDSLLDISEAGGTDDNFDGQVDDQADQGLILVPVDSDFDTAPDFLDLESNNPLDDGTDFDIANNPLPAPGAASFDIAPVNGQVDDDTDTDGDGIPDVVDLDPTNFGGGLDSDLDMVPDVIDLDADNDGIPNIAEGFDAANPLNSTDTDDDGVPDYLDLDSDNDGTSDLREAAPGREALDLDNDGRIDGGIFTDLLPASNVDGLHDPIATTFAPTNSHNGSLPDFQNTDSDNDGLTDLQESDLGGLSVSDLDADGDGEIDNSDLVTGLTLDGVSQPTNVQQLDTDGDGAVNRLDLDSDGDGFSDAIEAQGANGLLDSQQAGTGELETSVAGGGSVGWAGLLVLLVMSLRKKFLVKASGALSASFYSVVISAVLIVGMHTESVSADSHCAQSDLTSPNSDSFTGCWYGGLGYGLSHVDPEGVSNGWSTDDDSSDGWEAVIGRHFKPRWFAELKYADLGEAGLGNAEPAKDNAFPNAAISYDVLSLSAGYFLREEARRFHPYVKAGMASIANKAESDGGTVNFREVTSLQLALGLGVQYRPKNTHWFGRLNFDRYDRDAWFTSLSVGYYFGRQRSRATVPDVESVATALTVQEPESSSNQPIADSAAPVDSNVVSKVAPVAVAPAASQKFCEQFSQAIVEGIVFKSGSTELTADARSVLLPYAKSLREAPDAIVSIEAHTDWQGSADSNLALSMGRAQSVANLLVANGVDYSQLRILGLGEARPLADNTTREGRAINRRVEIKVESDHSCN